MLDKVETEIIGGVAHLLGTAGTAGTVGTVGRPLAEMGGMVVHPLVETMEVGEEGGRLHAALGTPQSLDGRTHQRGQTDLVRVQVHAEIPTVTKVRLTRAMVFCYPTVNLMLFILLN